MELLRATSAMPYVSKIVEYENKKYLDGGISDSIPVEKCKELGFDKMIAKIFYKKYPNLAKTINNRYINYNNSVEKVIELEKEKSIFVIRPTKTIKIKRIERDPEKLQEMYNLGIEDAKNKIKELKKYIEK